MQQHELQMTALAGTRLDMSQTPQLIAEMNPSHCKTTFSVWDNNGQLFLRVTKVIQNASALSFLDMVCVLCGDIGIDVVLERCRRDSSVKSRVSQTVAVKEGEKSNFYLTRGIAGHIYRGNVVLLHFALRLTSIPRSLKIGRS